MKKVILLIVALFAASFTFANQEIAVKNACVACHAADYYRIGPSYKDIAKRYGVADREAAIELLFLKVRQGSVGAWGEMPMPPQPQGSDDDIKALLKWMLNNY